MSPFSSFSEAKILQKMESPNVVMKLVVAVCEGNGIGKNNTLPWRLKSELAHFARLTKSTKDASKQNAVIMGRKTWQSIPERFRPLKGRFNVVLSSRPQTEISTSKDSVVVCKSFAEGMQCIEDLAEDNNIESCWVIGGSSVYAEAMKHSTLKKIYLTQILNNFDCDTFFPSIDTQEWNLVTDEAVDTALQQEDGFQFKYLVYERK